MRIMTARYNGRCDSCGEPIRKGESIAYFGRGRGAEHAACATADPRDQAEYAAGLADGRRYQAEKAIYGEALAEQFNAMDEHNRYWKYGEE